MPASEYTKQDRANEGCCWDYVRQLCGGGGCLCDCHATTEQILLSSRATLRRQNGELEADNGRMMGEISRQAARIAALDAEVASLREAGEALYEWVSVARPGATGTNLQTAREWTALALWRAALAVAQAGEA